MGGIIKLRFWHAALDNCANFVSEWLDSRINVKLNSKCKCPRRFTLIYPFPTVSTAALDVFRWSCALDGCLPSTDKILFAGLIVLFRLLEALEAAEKWYFDHRNIFLPSSLLSKQPPHFFSLIQAAGRIGVFLHGRRLGYCESGGNPRRRRPKLLFFY